VSQTKKTTKDTLILKTLAKVLENQKKILDVFDTLNENVVTVAEIVDELASKENKDG